MPYDWSNPYDSVIPYDVGNPQSITSSGVQSSETFGTTGESVPINIVIPGIPSSESLSPVSRQSFDTLFVPGIVDLTSFSVPTVVVLSSSPLIVQTARNLNVIVGGSQIPFTVANVSAGNFIILAAAIQAPRVITGVTDTAGNIYTKAISNINAGLSTVTIWSAPIIFGGGTKPTVNINVTGGNNVFAFLWEYSGINIAAPSGYAATASLSGDSGINVTSGTINTNSVNDVLVGICICASAITSHTSGWAAIAGFSNANISAETFLAHTPDMYAATFTQTAATDYNAAIASFRSAVLAPVNMGRIL